MGPRLLGWMYQWKKLRVNGVLGKSWLPHVRYHVFCTSGQARSLALYQWGRGYATEAGIIIFPRVAADRYSSARANEVNLCQFSHSLISWACERPDGSRSKYEVGISRDFDNSRKYSLTWNNTYFLGLLKRDKCKQSFPMRMSVCLQETQAFRVFQYDKPHRLPGHQRPVYDMP